MLSHVIRIFVIGTVLFLASGVVSADYQGTWIQGGDAPSSPNGPSRRGWVDLAFDSYSGSIALFGGSGGDYYNDIWFYNSVGKQWMNQELNVPCAALRDHFPPAKRDEMAVEYESVNDLLWIYSGSGFNCKGKATTAGGGTLTDRVELDVSLREVENFYQHWTIQVANKVAFVKSYDATQNIAILSIANK